MIVIIITTILIVAVTKILWSYINCIINLKNYPPGPFPLPIIGNIHMMMGPKLNERLRDLAEVYGDVFSLSFGTKRVVMVNAIEPTREALITKATYFSGRPDDQHTLELISKGGNKGVVFADYGDYWKTTRKLCHTALKRYGDNIDKMEENIIKESEELHARLRCYGGKPVNLHHDFGLAVMNVMISMLFGQRYEIGDHEFNKFLEMNDLTVEGIQAGDLIGFIPWLRFIPIYKPYEKIKKAVEIRDVMVGKKLEEHLNTYDPNNIRDFTDSLIKYSKDAEMLSGSVEITNDNLLLVIWDMIGAGSETASTTLKWCVLYLLHYPKYQALLHNEIIQTIGTERYPELKDHKSLHLVQAVIQEVLRIAAIAELGVVHKANKSGTIGGENIPKGTYLFFNIWNLHHDKRVWDNPDEFNPERWLDEEGKYTPGKRSFLPFSLGKRSCPGESMARAELFLFFARLVRDFEFTPNMNDAFPSIEDRRHGINALPLPFTVIMTSRLN